MTALLHNDAFRLAAFLALLACVSMVTGCKSDSPVSPKVAETEPAMAVSCITKDGDEPLVFYNVATMVVAGQVALSFTYNRREFLPRGSICVAEVQ